MVRQDYKTQIHYGTASLCFIILPASLCRLLKIRCRYGTIICGVCKGFFYKKRRFRHYRQKSPLILIITVALKHINARGKHNKFVFADAQILIHRFVKFLVVFNRKIAQTDALYFTCVLIADIQTAVVFRDCNGV